MQRLTILAAILLPTYVVDQSADNAKPSWSFSASANSYFVPDDQNYVQPSFFADYERFHFEARYNYEDLETGSLWVGTNFSVGKKVLLSIVPMVGGVFGETHGAAPGYRGTLSWGLIEFYSEGEYLFDTEKPADSFFYNWSELTVTPASWLRTGLVAQRTQAYQSQREIQSGFLIGVQHKSFQVTVDVFNPDLEKPLTVVSLGVEF